MERTECGCSTRGESFRSPHCWWFLPDAAATCVPAIEGPFPKKLSAWRLFTGTGSDLKPNRGVIPYDLNTTLFSDYASKHRFVWMPQGQAAEYKPDDTFEFPRGTILVKTFAYPDAALGGKERRIETRLLVNSNDGWFALPYVWNAAQTDAALDMNADAVDVKWKNPAGAGTSIHYAIPNANSAASATIRTRSRVRSVLRRVTLNRDIDYPEGRFNQLAYWTRIGYLKGAPGSRAGAASGRVGRCLVADRSNLAHARIST